MSDAMVTRQMSEGKKEIASHAWQEAAAFVDGLSAKQTDKYADMTIKEAKRERLMKKGLM